jgi:hypothetical protein
VCFRAKRGFVAPGTSDIACSVPISAVTGMEPAGVPSASVEDSTLNMGIGELCVLTRASRTSIALTDHVPSEAFKAGTCWRSSTARRCTNALTCKCQMLAPRRQTLVCPHGPLARSGLGLDPRPGLRSHLLHWPSQHNLGTSVHQHCRGSCDG